MSSYINLFLKTELTPLPHLLKESFGDYYNNTVFNAVTWLFLSWTLLHQLFNNGLNALFLKMGYKEYLRVRLIKSLWYFAFYTTTFVYSIATLHKSGVKILSFCNTSENFDLISGFILLGSFFLHSFVWEILQNLCFFDGFGYLCLFGVTVLSHFLRFAEGSLKLIILISLSKIILEITRCIEVLNEMGKRKVLIQIFFYTSIITCITNQIILSFFIFGYTIGFISKESSIFVIYLTWLLLDTQNSPLYKLIYHYLYHKHEDYEDKEPDFCPDLLQCALFPPRNDEAHNFAIFRKEMKERAEKCKSLRKPKNHNMVMQTLKCMVAIKRKIKERRRLKNNSDSSEDEEQTEDGVLGAKLSFNIKNNESVNKNSQSGTKTKED